MEEATEESFRAKVRAIFAEHFGEAAGVLDLVVDEPFASAVMRACPDMALTVRGTSLSTFRIGVRTAHSCSRSVWLRSGLRRRRWKRA